MGNDMTRSPYLSCAYRTSGRPPDRRDDSAGPSAGLEPAGRLPGAWGGRAVRRSERDPGSVVRRSIVRDGAPALLEARPGALGGEPGFVCAFGGTRRPPGGRIGAQRIGEERPEALERQLAIARLAPLLRRHDPHAALRVDTGPEALEHPGALTGAERRRGARVEDELDPRIAC